MRREKMQSSLETILDRTLAVKDYRFVLAVWFCGIGRVLARIVNPRAARRKRYPFTLKVVTWKTRKNRTKVIINMKISYMVVIAALLALVSMASAQNPFDAAAESLQSQVTAAGEQLQQKAVQHIAEGNLTQEHIAQDFNATAENLTKMAKQELGQKLNQDLNITPAELEQRAKEELKRPA